jgi:hypothetical protein
MVAENARHGCRGNRCRVYSRVLRSDDVCRPFDGYPPGESEVGSIAEAPSQPDPIGQAMIEYA